MRKTAIRPEEVDFWKFHMEDPLIGQIFLPTPTPPALQTVSHPQYILRYRQRTSHNVNYRLQHRL